MHSADAIHEKRHPIQVAARRAGLSPHVLRAWEKRYGDVVAPGRSAGGRRLYSDADIERLRLLHEATRAGRRIGDVAGVSTRDLEALVAEDHLTRQPPPDQHAAPLIVSTRDYASEGIDAALNLDEQQLERILEQAVLSLPLLRWINEVIVPLMLQIGHMWSEGTLTPGHEHFVSTIVSRRMASVIASLAPAVDAPRVIVTTPSGTRHEIGALLAAMAAAAEGWHVTYLGSDLPAKDIAAVAHRVDAACVCLSIVYPTNDQQVHDELKTLRRELDDSVAMVIGGRAAGTYRVTLDEIGATFVPELVDLRAVLEPLSTSR